MAPSTEAPQRHIEAAACKVAVPSHSHRDVGPPRVASGYSRHPWHLVAGVSCPSGYHAGVRGAGLVLRPGQAPARPISALELAVDDVAGLGHVAVRCLLGCDARGAEELPGHPRPTFQKAYGLFFIFIYLLSFFMCVCVLDFVLMRMLTNVNAESAQTVKQTLLLEYKHIIPFVDPIKAVRNRHYLLAACMTLRIAIWAATGLSAAVFSVANVPVAANAEFTTSFFFDDVKGGDRTVYSTKPALDMVASNLLYNGSLLAWTTRNHSFLPFNLTSEDRAKNGPINITATTEAYSATLDCALFQADDFLSQGLLTMETVSTGTLLRYSLVDRGCNVTDKYLLRKNVSVSKSWAMATCPTAAGQVRYGLVKGDYDSTSPFLLTNVTFLSCIPTFWKENRLVTVRSGLQSPGEVADDVEAALGNGTGSRTKIVPNFGNSWVTNLPQYIIVEPVHLFDGDSLGYIVYGLRRLLSTDQHNGTLDTQSFQTAFRAVYASFVSTSVYKPAEAAVRHQGSTSIQQNMLFVVKGPAIAVITIVAITLVVTFVLTFWLWKRSSVLKKHLDRIFGHALLLHGSTDISAFIDDVKRSASLDSQLANSSAASGKANGNSNPPAPPGARPMPSQGNKGIDLVEYADRTKALNERKCWIGDKDNVLHIEPL